MHRRYLCVVFSLLLSIPIISLYSLPAFSAEDPWEATLRDVHFSPKLKNLKIAVLRFLPLPQKSDGLVPHERVFTGELYSQKPTDPEINGLLIPRNYLEILDNSLYLLNRMYGLKIEIAENTEEIPVDADYVVFGAVKFFGASTQAVVSFDVQVMRGRTFAPLKKTSIEKTLNFANIPWIANQPIHMIGNHAVDFHPQRDILNLTSFLCMVDLFTLIDNEVQP